MSAAPSLPPRQTVLLVDDDYGSIEILADVLEQHGFEVTLASSPRRAVQVLGHLRVDAVVTDVVFDGRPLGNELLTACRELCPEAVVILMTGHPLIEGAVWAIKGGAVDYLQKPIDPVVLAANVHRAIRERRMQGESLEFLDLVDILSEMVAHTIERVDPYTAGHGQRTRRYCRLIAEELALERRTVERLELAAIAHDYGKIYLDDLGFLTKAGPLTAQEYRQVQQHPQLGARKLGDHPQLEEVCRFVAEHHEKWDGTGYPHRLRGDEISMAGRILGIVEVFDSLSTKRSYKEPWALGKTLDFFEAQSGRAFDPAVTAVFLRLLEERGEEWLRAPEHDLEAAGVRPRE